MQKTLIPADERPAWTYVLIFLLLHIAPFGALFTGVKASDVWVGIILYFARVFFITGFYHRYFSHKTFKTSRAMQAVMAFLGTTAGQNGPIWWPAHHRHHHKHADTEKDISSPAKGFFWSHIGWLLCPKYKNAPVEMMSDFKKYPEIVWIDKYNILGPVIMGLACLYFGGLSMLFIGFFASTIVLYHVTWSINSLTHMFGKRNHDTRDDSRNSWFLAIISLGEWLHNNHHYRPGSAKFSEKWYEFDLGYGLLRIMSWTRLIWDLKVPQAKTA